MMMGDDSDQHERTIWCGNISDQVTDDLLYELFLQAGPLESIRRPKDPSNGRPRSYAFIVYKHACTVPYALELFRGEQLFNRTLNISSKSLQHHTPVLETHLTEFNEHLDDKPQQRTGKRDHRNDRKRSYKEKDDNEPTSWAELNALRGKGSLMNGHPTFNKDGLLGAPLHNKESKAQGNPACFADFEQLLQMGSQMMLPGMLSFAGSPLRTMGSMGPVNPIGLNPMGSLGQLGPMGSMGQLGAMGSMGQLGPVGPMGLDMYPSMQGNMSGGKRHSPEKERRWNDRHEGRGSRRDHPYQDKRQGHNSDRRHSDNHYDHRRHDRGYSSSRTSHERERRDRRSR